MDQRACLQGDIDSYKVASYMYVFLSPGIAL